MENDPKNNIERHTDMYMYMCIYIYIKLYKYNI